jgi:RNA polymerase sigma-70 factor (sigma-E family)
VDFEDYVATRGQALVRFAYVLTLDPYLAEDLAQSALADVYRHWGRVSRADHVDAYVRKAVVNSHLSWRRRRSSGEVPTDVLAPNDEHAVDEFDAVADRDATRTLLRGLAPRARTVLVLRYYVDLDDQAIAELMGISVSGVRATASRALASIRLHMPADGTGSPMEGRR